MVAEQGTPAALAATGFIWVRYSLVIKPINYSLAAVCICLYRFLLGSHAPRVYYR